ncbi:MAG: cysteine hydrolase family protein [Oscillospiraceae bacterium]
MNRLLIVVDYQNDFVCGSLGFPGAEKLAGPIAERIREYRTAGDEVVFTFDTHEPGYLDTQEGCKLPVPHCVRDTEGWALYGPVAEVMQDGDTSFRKPTFPSLELGKWLEGRAYDRVELCGLVSNICVLSNAVIAKAALPEAEIIVDANLTASSDPILHEKALDVLAGIQVTVLNRKEDHT